MKINYLILCTLCAILTSCTTKEQSNGWYFITDVEAKTFDKAPIVTVADFETLQLDSSLMADNLTVYQIEGKIKDDKIQLWERATEKAIGTHIGFLYKGEIIASPQINLKIEGGGFAISSQELSQDGKKMREIFEHLKKEVESNH